MDTLVTVARLQWLQSTLVPTVATGHMFHLAHEETISVTDEAHSHKSPPSKVNRDIFV